jgi:hypothetical protein
MRSIFSAVLRFAREAFVALRRLPRRRNTKATVPPQTHRDPPAGEPSFTTPTIETYDPRNPFQQLGLHQVSNVDGGSSSSFDRVQRALDQTCALLAGRNFAVSSSRIEAYRHFFQRMGQAAEEKRHFTAKEEIELYNTLVEVFELWTITSAATVSPDPLMWDSHLKKLIAGTHPHTNLKEAAAWNFQYEMFLAAVIQLSGYEIKLAEPDVVIKDARRTVGIAAKRIHSPKKLTNNLRKGAHQIRGAGMSGLVAVDLSLIVGQNRCLFADDLPGARVAVRYLVDQFVKDHYSEIKRALHGTHVMGCLFTLNMPAMARLEGGYGQMATASRWTIVDLSEDFPDFEWIREFANKCELGLFRSP